MEIRELQTFVQIAQLHSFSRAAERLGYSQAAVTIQIKQLETELGVRLLDRIGKKISLTYDGELLLQYASAILRDVRDAKERLSDHRTLRGRLRIGTIESICTSLFSTLMSRFHDLYPEVSVSLVADSPDALLAMMDQNQLDLVYILDRPIYNNSWIKVMELPDEVVFVTSPTHNPTLVDVTCMSDLLSAPFVLTEKDASYRKLMEQQLAARGLDIRPFLSTGNTDFIVRMLLQRPGVSFLPHFVVQSQLDSGELAVIPIGDFEVQVWRQIFYHKDKWVTGEMRAFLELAVPAEECS